MRASRAPGWIGAVGRGGRRRGAGPEARGGSAELRSAFALFLRLLRGGAEYRSAILAEEDIAFSPLALAAIEALVLAKFLLIGRAARPGERLRDDHPARATLARSALFTAFLIVLVLVEESVVGLIHGRTVGDALGEMLSGRVPVVAASVVLIRLVLLPSLALHEMRARLSEGSWHNLLAGRSPGA
jgi:hypothetical protein